MLDLNVPKDLQSKTTLAGMRERLDMKWVRPEPMSRTDFEALAPPDRKAYDDARLAWLGVGMWVRTPYIDRLTKSTMATVRTSHPLATGRRGIVMSGPANIGKTTALDRLAHTFETYTAKYTPDFRSKGQVPVVHIDMQAKATPKSIAAAVLDFFGTPYGARDTHWELVPDAVRALQIHRTQVLIIDELQMLKLDGRSGDDAINTLKTIMNDSGAVCVFSGIDLRVGLSSKAAKQIMDRCEKVDLLPFTLATETERANWHAVVNQFGNEMRLLDAEPNHLAPFADALFDATGGSLGELRRIACAVAADAMYERDFGAGEEVVTAETLLPWMPMGTTTSSAA